MNETPTRPEMLAVAAFYMFASRSEALMDPADHLKAPGDLRARIRLNDLAAKYGIAQDEIRAGLAAHAARGTIRFLADTAPPGVAIVEAIRDPRGAAGWEPQTIVAGVQLLTANVGDTPRVLRAT